MFDEYRFGLTLCTKLILTILILAPKEPHASEQIQLSAFPASELEATLAAKDTDFAKAIANERKKRIPKVIIIPGVMGSKLTDAATGKIFWGRNVDSDDAHLLKYNPEQETKAEILDVYEFWQIKKDVYGEALEKIQEIYLENPSFFEVFAYDWRQDNKLSAKEFGTWICSRKDVLDGSNVIFIAHSMGGLVLKQWIRSEFNTKTISCGDGGNMTFNTSKVAFVGVPHYGAPQAIHSFANGFTLAASDRPDTWFGGIVKWLDQQTLSAPINKYGYTFPSAYQLLPIYESGCIGKRNSDIPTPLTRKIDDGTPKLQTYVFAHNLWKTMKWPHSTDGVPETFNNQEVANLIDQGLNFLCNLAKSPLPEHIVPSYFTSNSFQTISSCHINGSQANCNETMGGDGTVPYYSAREMFSDTPPIPYDVGGELKHPYMLKSKSLWQFVFNQVQSAKNNPVVDGAAANFRLQETLIEAYAQSSAVPAYSPIHITPEQQEVYNRIIEGVFAKFDITPAQIYSQSRGENVPADVKKSIYRYVQTTNSPNVSSANKAFAGNRLTLSFVDSEDWTAAIEIGEEVKRSDAFQNLKTEDKDDVQLYLENNLGQAFLNNKQTIEAAEAFERAAKLGNPKARQNLISTQNILQSTSFSN